MIFKNFLKSEPLSSFAGILLFCNLCEGLEEALKGHVWLVLVDLAKDKVQTLLIH